MKASQLLGKEVVIRWPGEETKQGCVVSATHDPQWALIEDRYKMKHYVNLGIAISVSIIEGEDK